MRSQRTKARPCVRLVPTSLPEYMSRLLTLTTSTVLLLLLQTCTQRQAQTHSAVSFVAEAYVVSSPAHQLPTTRQSEWLKEMTNDICNQPMGQLSDEAVTSVPRIMSGWMKLQSPVRSTESAVAVEQLLKRLIDERAAGNAKAIATTDDYNCLLESWAKSGAGAFAAQRCESIVREMEQLYHSNEDVHVQPNLSSFKTVLMAWRHADHRHYTVRNDFSSNSKGNLHKNNINNNNNINNPAIRAQRVLEWMVNLQKSGKNEEAMPDSDCFDIVLQSWSHSTMPDAPVHAERLLGAMERLRRETGCVRLTPKATSFNAVLGTWMRSKSDKASTRVVDILGFMDHLHLNEGNHHVKPDAYTYSTVINTLSHGGNALSARKAELILRRLEKEHREGTLGWEPDTILFNTVINCWSKSQASGSFRYARSILDRQKLWYQSGCDTAVPDVFGYSSVISNCASEFNVKQHGKDAFDTAIRTFQELKANSREFGMAPNHVTYGTMMKACVRLLPPSSRQRKKWMARLMHECIEQGQVGDMVLSRLREGTSRAEYKRLMHGHTRSTMPPAWSANVNEKSAYRRSTRKRKGRTGEV